MQALKWNKRWPSGFDLNRLTAGSSKELALHAGTINAVCEQYAKSRSQKKRPFLRWRGRRSLGWVPLKGRDLRREGEAFRFVRFSVLGSGFGFESPSDSRFEEGSAGNSGRILGPAGRSGVVLRGTKPRLQLLQK